MEIPRKYKIDEALNKLNLPNYKLALKVIPKMLCIAPNTFHNYRRLPINAKADLPYKMVRKLETIFEMKSGQLANYRIRCKTLNRCIEEDQA